MLVRQPVLALYTGMTVLGVGFCAQELKGARSVGKVSDGAGRYESGTNCEKINERLQEFFWTR